MTQKQVRLYNKKLEYLNVTDQSPNCPSLNKKYSQEILYSIYL